MVAAQSSSRRGQPLIPTSERHLGVRNAAVAREMNGIVPPQGVDLRQASRVTDQWSVNRYFGDVPPYRFQATSDGASLIRGNSSSSCSGGERRAELDVSDGNTEEDLARLDQFSELRRAVFSQ